MARLPVLRGVMVGAVLLSSGCASVTLPESGPQSLEGYRPTRNIGLLDSRQRREELARLSESQREDLCLERSLYRAPPIPVEVTGHGPGGSIYSHYNPFGDAWRYVDDMVGGWLTTQDRAYLDSLREWLLESKRQGGFTRLRPDPDKYYLLDPLFNLRFGLKPVFVAYDVLQQEGAITEEQQTILHQWLEEVVESTDLGYCGEMEDWCDSPNHTTMHAGSTFMLWGGVTSNPKWFRKGIDYFVDALRNTRSDGSNAFDVSARKGRRSVRKQNQIVGYLVVIAEVAARHGYDLYSIKVVDASMWSNFEFLVNVLDNSSLLKRHTGSASFDEPFLHHNRHNDETVAWFELLRRRFPDDPRVVRFTKKVFASRPWSSPAYGGNLTCFVGQFAARE